MGLLNAIVLALVFMTAPVAFLESFAENRAYAGTGFLASIVTIVLYAGAISYLIATACQGMSGCLSGHIPIGYH